MLHQPIPDAIRTANSKAILKSFPIAMQPADMQRSALFALTAGGGADDRFALGPYTRPSLIEAVSFVSALDPATTRTFSLHLSTDDSITAIGPNDVNILDPLSPSSTWMPGRTQITVPIGRPSPFHKFWIKLSRQKGGSTTYELTVWVYIKQVA